MGTSIVRHLSPEELAQLQATKESAERMSSGTPPGKFIFFLAFDGTNNDKENLPQTKLPLPDANYQTNVANLFDQAERSESARFNARYYPGVGTGGEQGNWINAGILPTEPLRGIADGALHEFAWQARDYLKSNPTATYADLSVSMVSFSRGGAAAMIFAHKLEKEGLVLADGTQIAPPGVVPITSNVMFDPVMRFVNDDLSLPSNVRGQTLLIAARDEQRSDFRLANYAHDPRVTQVVLAGNHCGIGGGYDLHGTSAAALEIATAYLRNSGVPVADVRPELRFDPGKAIPIYSESRQVARNGDALGTEEHPALAWRVDRSSARQTAPVSPPIVVPHAPPPMLDDPAHPGHTMFKQAREAMRQLDARHNRTSDLRTDQAAAAITAQAFKDGLRKVNGIVTSTDASNLFAIDGTPGSVLSKMSSVPTMEALDTPIAQSTQAYEQSAMQAQQQERERVLQQEQQFRGSPAMAR